MEICEEKPVSCYMIINIKSLCSSKVDSFILFTFPVILDAFNIFCGHYLAKQHTCIRDLKSTQ